MDDAQTITSLGALQSLYDAPSERVRLKQIDRLDGHCQAFIAASPFLILATCGSSGADGSPRGDRPGFVEVQDDTTLLLPDRRGNNRIDSLRNIVENPAVGLIFLVPGVHETFRVNGRARISVDPALLARFAVDGKTPKTVLVITVQEAFIQCARALVRSDLWNPARHVRRDELPSIGTILAAHTGGKVDAATYDAEAAVTMRRTLY
ncbi:MAG TPA: pyridoxamine 5'-phosphate oxidase family protein [Thermoanaerobaculia bacterium]|jgi:PPOX class probable FMN-dependent enzyme|nr:pyridoxamine 5'-phosphate oxidase family protein [Thermoanaerobaculia bacterium]